MMRQTSNRSDQPKGCLSHSAVEPQPITSLKPHLRNPRTHSKRQIEQLTDSIRAFGFVNPVLIDAERRIIAGHGRVEAARRLGNGKTSPVIFVDHMNEAEKHAYAIADNRLAELAGWWGPRTAPHRTPPPKISGLSIPGAASHCPGRRRRRGTGGAARRRQARRRRRAAQRRGGARRRAAWPRQRHDRAADDDDGQRRRPPWHVPIDRHASGSDGPPTASS